MLPKCVVNNVQWQMNETNQNLDFNVITCIRLSATLGLNKLQVTKADVHCARNVEGLHGFHVAL